MKSDPKAMATMPFVVAKTLGKDDIFQAIIDHPEGLWIGKVDPENNFVNIKTDDNRINLYIPEVEEWVKSITPESAEQQLQSDGKINLSALT